MEEFQQLINGDECEFEVIKRLTGEDIGKVKGNYIKIDADKAYQYIKPILLCLDGNGNTNLKNANGFAKGLVNTVNINDEVEVISVRYRPKSKKAKTTTGILSFEDIQKLVDCFFMPLLQKDGKRLSVVNAKRNIQKISVFSYCYGAKVLNDINAVLKSRMLELGFKEDKITQILKCITNVCYAPYCKNEDNTNLNIKSFDDAFFGEDYREQAKEKIDNLPRKEREKFYLEKFLYIGNGVIFNDQDFNLYAQNLNGSVLELEDDHLIGSVMKNEKGEFLSDKDNLHSHTVSKCLKLIINKVIENSLVNQQNFKELDLREIEKECNEIINVANANETEMIKRRVLQLSLQIVPVKEALRRMGITEKDFLTHKVTIESINKNFVGRIDYAGTIYEKIKYVKNLNSNVKKQVYNKENIIVTELMPHNKGIITSEGNLIYLDKNDAFENVNLAMMLQKFDPIGSIRYSIEKQNGEKVIVLSDNYGSRYATIKSTFESQILDWLHEYADNNLTVQLSEKQKIVLRNLCTFFNIKSKNIMHNNERGLKI